MDKSLGMCPPTWYCFKKLAFLGAASSGAGIGRSSIQMSSSTEEAQLGPRFEIGQTFFCKLDQITEQV